MKKIYLIRHAESESNVGGIFEHNKLVKLTENGKQQARDLVEVLEKPDRIIVSKYIRTQETAEPLIQKYSDVDTHMWLDTHEFDYLDRKPFLDQPKAVFEEYAKKYWNDRDAHVRLLENGETFQEFVDRVHNVILKMDKLEGINYIFTHGIFIMIFTLLVKYYSREKYDKERLSTNFYNEIMKRSDELYKAGEIVQLKNTEVFDVTELVEKYAQ